MTGKTAPRLVYLLPSYDANSAEHFYHLYGFLDRLQHRLPVTIFVEKMHGDAAGLTMTPIRIRLPAFRLLEETARFFLARLRGADVFYVHYSFTGAIAASLVSRLTGGAAYYWNCGMYAEMAPAADAPLRERLGYRWGRFLLETSVRACRYLVTGTPRMAEYYVRHAGISRTKIRVLPNFVDGERFRAVTREEARRSLGIAAGRKVILYLHRVSLHRGAGLLPPLAAALKATSLPWTILVAGDGSYLQDLRKIAEARGLEGNFRFAGWVPNRDAPRYYRAADLYILPSDVEGFPRVLVEAMAAGSPFVSFDVGGVGDVVPDSMSWSIVPAGDAEEFIARCLHLLEDDGKRDALGRAGLEHSALFSEERVLESFVDMIRGEAQDWNKFSASAAVHE